MDRITVLDNEYVTIWVYPDEKIVHHQIHKYIFGEPFRELLLTGTAQMAKYHGTKWLSDDRANPVVSKEDIEWGAQNWIPQTVKAGWKYWAIIEPEQPIGQMVMEGLVKRYGEMGIIAQFFKDEKKAFDWLASQN